MRCHIFPVFFAVTLTIAALSTPASAQAPAMRWGGRADSNMAGNARQLPVDLAAATTLWEAKVGTHQYAIPSIDHARGRIYVAANDAATSRPGYKITQGGAVICLDQATGQRRWTLPIPRYFPGVIPPMHFDQWRCGVCSEPVIDGDRLYVVGSRGDILCLDVNGQANGNDGPFVDELKYMDIPTTSPGAALTPADGDIVWKFDLIPNLDVVLHDVCGSTIQLVGDLLYVCTSNGIDNVHKLVPRPQAPSLIVLDKKTGRLVARDDERIGERLQHCNWSSPIAWRVGGRTLIFFGAGDGLLYAFEEPQNIPGAPVQILKKVWSHDCDPPEYRFRDGVKIPYSTDRKKRPDGPSEIVGVPVLSDGRVYVAIGASPLYGVGQGCLSCVDAATGKLVWESRLVGRTLANPAISGGLLYITDLAGDLHCLDAATGQRYWVHPMGGQTWTSSPLVADGKVYAGTEKGMLWALAAGKELRVLSQLKLKTSPMTLIADDGVLYIPTQTSLMAIADSSLKK